MRVRQQLYIVAVSYWLVVWAAFSVTYTCLSSDGPLPEFYGFPFVSHSGNSNHHTSLFGYVFPAGFVLNMLVWVVVLNGVAVLARR